MYRFIYYIENRFGEEDNPDPMFHPCKGLFQTCCSLKTDTPMIPKIEKKDGCGHRNYDGRSIHSINVYISNEHP